MKKPNTRIMDYVTLAQDGILSVEDMPKDVQDQVTKLVRYFAGVEDNNVKPVTNEKAGVANV